MQKEVGQETMEVDNEQSFLIERFELAWERIAEIQTEAVCEEKHQVYFKRVASFLDMIHENYEFVKKNGFENASLEELKQRNHALYEDVLPEHYEQSYGNPTYCAKCFGQDMGSALSVLYTELRSLIGFAYEQQLEEVVIRLELFLEVYAAFSYEWEENQKHPSVENIKNILYWFASDYADVAALNKTRQLVTTAEGFAASIIKESDLTDCRYLFRYGEYVSGNEIKMANYMANLPESTIATMADTYTEGYRIGFVTTGKDLSKKKIVDVRYCLGFERMMRRALENFEKMGLQPAIYRSVFSILYNAGIYKIGFYGGEANRQFEFDHKDDKALFLDKNYVNRRLEVSHTAFEQYKDEARLYAGPAVVETFGEAEFEPINKPEALKLTKEQNDLWVEYRTKAGEIQRQYIIEEERSFTIIAFPVPEIGDVFETLFDETIKINTLDYTLYRDMQQVIIDALDQASYCVIKGMGENHTDLKVSLITLKNPEKETIFENCVADVNIPVGEVFTSPVLKETTGCLHVKKVFLNGLEYRDFEIQFKDGMIVNYNCKNFEKEEENKAFVKENVLYRHETLPIGEFAIGTNTTAYMVAKKLGVADKFPILIAEKMGPHFAVGDTCYSHAEDVKVYNPDGKEIIARDNEVSLNRKSNPAKAYFDCHTDITIPYDELGELYGVTKEGKEIPIIKAGRFVLQGTEKLNEPFEK